MLGWRPCVGLPAMAWKVAFAGLLVASAEAHARKKVSWKLGSPRQDCDAVCSDSGMFCNPHDWPTSTLQLLQTSIPAKMTCKTLLDEPVSYAPYVRNLDKGECVYDSTAVTTSCTEKASGHARRICPCGSSAPTFFISSAGESCTSFCEDRGGSCNSDRKSRSLKEPYKLQEVASTLGFKCGTMNSVGVPPFFAPAINEDVCSFPASDLFTDCHAQAEGQRRFCQCIGANSQPAMEGSSGHHTVRFGTCSSENGFKSGEGVGGKEKRQVGTTVNAAQCRLKVMQSCDDANGATFVTTDKSCWCEIKMTGYQYTANTMVCWFSDGVMTSNFNNALPRLWAMLPARTDSSAASTGVAALVATAVVGAAVVARRRPANVELDAAAVEGLVTDQ